VCARYITAGSGPQNRAWSISRSSALGANKQLGTARLCETH
jgi:hypothetical protein